jgi:hypothetical protein
MPGERVADMRTVGDVPLHNVAKLAAGSKNLAIRAEGDVGGAGIRGSYATAERRIIIHVNYLYFVLLASQ